MQNIVVASVAIPSDSRVRQAKSPSHVDGILIQILLLS